jgi:hypothetical protein
MAAAYAWADLVICRAGALTLAELAAAGVPAILVPYPHAVDDHQTRNAEAMVAVGAARLVPEADEFVKRLGAVFEEIGERAKLLGMATAARTLAKPDAAARIADPRSSDPPTTRCRPASALRQVAPFARQGRAAAGRRYRGPHANGYPRGRPALSPPPTA